MARSPEKQISFQLKNDLSELSELARQLERFAETADLPREALFRLNLALEEVFANIVYYGYADDAVHVVDFTLIRDDSGMTFRITDGGVPFNPLTAPPPDTLCFLSERQVGGLGLALTKHCMDDIQYRRIGDRNVLTMTKSF